MEKGRIVLGWQEQNQSGSSVTAVAVGESMSDAFSPGANFLSDSSGF